MTERKDLTDGRGADIVIECAGSPRLVPEGLSMLRMGGTYLDVGNAVDQGEISFNPYDICWRSIRCIGQMNLAYTGFIPSIRFFESTGDIGFVAAGARELMKKFPGHAPRTSRGDGHV